MKRLPVTSPDGRRRSDRRAWTRAPVTTGVDRPPGPLPILPLLEPEQPVVVPGPAMTSFRPSPLTSRTCMKPSSSSLGGGRRARCSGRLAGDRAPGTFDRFPVCVEGPVACPWIGWRFEPPARREDVGALVAVDVSGADAMTVALIADLVRHPGAVLDFVPGLRGAVLLRDDFVAPCRRCPCRRGRRTRC